LRRLPASRKAPEASATGDLANPAALATRLDEGLNALGLELPERAREVYLAYLALLVKWNRAYNLTAIRSPQRMLTHHLLDSLALLPWIEGPECLDVGTGAGLPGLVLAIARPDTRWVLLDSGIKKIRFVQQAALELHLPNVEIARGRVESWMPQRRFITITARAVAPLPELWRWCHRLLVAGGRLLCMKGDPPPDEMAALAGQPVDCETHRLTVPGIQAARTLVVISARAR
jgi:16S rRNA (guanine527-N7)-methyltransferase